MPSAGAWAPEANRSPTRPERSEDASLPRPTVPPAGRAERDDAIGERPEIGVRELTRVAGHRRAGQAGRDRPRGGAASIRGRSTVVAGAGVAPAARSMSRLGELQPRDHRRGRPRHGVPRRSQAASTARRRVVAFPGGSVPSAIGRLTAPAGPNPRTIAISSPISASLSTPANPGIDVPRAPNRSVARRSSSVGAAPNGVDRHSNAPRVKSRGSPREYGAAGPRPSPSVP